MKENEVLKVDLLRVSKVGLDYSSSSIRLIYSQSVLPPVDKLCVVTRLDSVSNSRIIHESEYLSGSQHVVIVGQFDKSWFNSILSSHVNEVGIPGSVDLLLSVDSIDVDSITSDDIDCLVSNPLVNSVGLMLGDSELSVLLKWEDKFPELIKSVGINICPVNFNFELVEYIKSSGKYVYGFNPFGGNLYSGQVIQAFTVPYLLSFASTYCDVVILNSEYRRSLDNALYVLGDLVGTEVDKKYILKKSVRRLAKPLKQIVYPSTVVIKDTIPGRPISPVSYGMTVTSLGKAKLELTVSEGDDDGVCTSLTQWANDWIDGKPYTDETKLMLIRHALRNTHLPIIHKCSEGWKFEMEAAVSDRSVVLLFSRFVRQGGIFGRFKEKVCDSKVCYAIHIIDGKVLVTKSNVAK